MSAQGHLLEPWAAYWELKARLETASAAEVQAFLARYPEPTLFTPVNEPMITASSTGYLAYWNHRSFKWDPKAWEFPGDEAANKLRDRERRDPWQLPAV